MKTVTISSMESTVNFLFSFLCYICTNTMHTYIFNILAYNLHIILEVFSLCVMDSMLTVDLAAPFVLSVSFFIFTSPECAIFSYTHTHTHTCGVSLQSHGTVQIILVTVIVLTAGSTRWCQVILLQAHCSVLLSVN